MMRFLSWIWVTWYFVWTNQIMRVLPSTYRRDRECLVKYFVGMSLFWASCGGLFHTAQTLEWFDLKSNVRWLWKYDFSGPLSVQLLVHWGIWTASLDAVSRFFCHMRQASKYEIIHMTEHQRMNQGSSKCRIYFQNDKYCDPFSLEMFPKWNVKFECVSSVEWSSGHGVAVVTIMHLLFGLKIRAPRPGGSRGHFRSCVGEIHNFFWISADLFCVRLCSMLEPEHLALRQLSRQLTYFSLKNPEHEAANLCRSYLCCGLPCLWSNLDLCSSSSRFLSPSWWSEKSFCVGRMWPYRLHCC